MKYFGTDGIRQPADAFTSDFLAKIVKGLVDYAGNGIKVFLAGDTRESTEWILADLQTACETFGLEYANAGILPTPAINYCFYQTGFDYAIDVTASHNPYTDNGIKIFERGATAGQKLNSEACRAIENALASDYQYTPISPTLREDLHQECIYLYIEHLKNYLGKTDLSRQRIGLDCANGATSVIGEQIFKTLGAAITPIHINTSYNTDINRDCGSTHLESLQKLVTENHLDYGIAFDGDGDRCLLIDHTGEIVDGDQIIAILANHLNLDKIAITIMANQGLLNWTKETGIKTEITPVGDSNVAEAMRNFNIQIGGEQSGHIILPNEPTGDGMLTSLMIAKTIAESNQTLHDLSSIFTKSPQVILNLTATPEQKVNLKSSDSVKKLLLDYNSKLEDQQGRLLVRPSGTEPLIRITMWGNDEKTITNLANELMDSLKKCL